MTHSRVLFEDRFQPSRLGAEPRRSLGFKRCKQQMLITCKHLRRRCLQPECRYSCVSHACHLSFCMTQMRWSLVCVVGLEPGGLWSQECHVLFPWAVNLGLKWRSRWLALLVVLRSFMEMVALHCWVGSWGYLMIVIGCAKVSSSFIFNVPHVGDVFMFSLGNDGGLFADLSGILRCPVRFWAQGFFQSWSQAAFASSWISWYYALCWTSSRVARSDYLSTELGAENNCSVC